MTRSVRIPAAGAWLDGDLTTPADARGLVIFAHGSGSGRHSPRNQYVAGVLQQASLATLLMDLLTREEEAIDLRTAHLRFDITLLADRLVAATDWAQQEPELRGLGIGYFGASTGGGAALVAAADRPVAVSAVVSRGGRPDLAGPALPRVQSPTLLIVGGRDAPVIGMNQEAMNRMTTEVKLRIVPGATHLFEEPGTLDAVARLAAEWFEARWPVSSLRRRTEGAEAPAPQGARSEDTGSIRPTSNAARQDASAAECSRNDETGH